MKPKANRYFKASGISPMLIVVAGPIAGPD
jgi:hypothetical protein